MLHAALLLLLVADGVEADVARAVARSGVSRNGLGLVVGEAGGEILYAIQPDEPRTPASNQKVLTAALALGNLGRDFEFRTVFGRDANGALVVVGDGDPNFSGRFFDGDPTRVMRMVARDLKKQGLESVEDGIVLDVSRFDDEIRHPDWPADQLDRWYCAPVAALVYNDSCWDITVAPASNIGARASVRVEPSLAPPSIENRCVTVAERARQIVHIAYADEKIRIDGSVVSSSRGLTSHLAVREPALFFGRALRAALVAEGVAVKGGVRKGAAGKFEEILVYKSDLRRTLDVMLTKSQNLYAECLFKRAGGGSFEAAGRAMRALDEGIDARDGSGLSANNRVTPRALYRVLQRFRDEPYLVDALAAGGEGTLRRRYRHLGTRLRAKTGYIRGVSSLSGYVESGRTEAGTKRYVFVVLCNGAATAHARKLQDLVVRALSEAN